MRARLLVFALCCGAFALPAHAFLNDTEARQQIADLRAELTQSVEALRQRVDTLGKNQFDFASQIETLRADVARLTGQIEVLTNGLDAAHKRQQDFYVDLDNRLRKLESAGMPQEGAPPGETMLPADPQAEMRDYEAALGLFRERKFKDAQTAFEAFAAAHAKSTLLPNAHYWLGSSLYQQKRYAEAAKAFGHVAATWPDDPKAPDALLAQANAQVGAKEVTVAIETLETLVKKYPANPAAETARARIKTLAPKKKR
jgi:tol-pal system protein YbgF